jgi:hypothetical protein
MSRAASSASEGASVAEPGPTGISRSNSARRTPSWPARRVPLAMYRHRTPRSARRSTTVKSCGFGSGSPMPLRTTALGENGSRRRIWRSSSGATSRPRHVVGVGAAQAAEVAPTARGDLDDAGGLAGALGVQAPDPGPQGAVRNARRRLVHGAVFPDELGVPESVQGVRDDHDGLHCLPPAETRARPVGPATVPRGGDPAPRPPRRRLSASMLRAARDLPEGRGAGRPRRHGTATHSATTR